MILLTTSRRPTRRVRTLCHDLARSIPNVIRVNRGKLSFDGVAEKALEFNADRVIIVDRWMGGPGKIQLFRVGPEGLISVPPLIYLRGIQLQRELEGGKPKLARSLVVTISPMQSDQNSRIAESLSNFLKVPLSSMNGAASRYQTSIHVSLDASGHTQVTFMLLLKTIEIGPRITISHVVWEAQR